MKRLVIGTAGHIDHGKTALTKALTGVDTDRLPEEKEREMTIDLGFAPLPLGPDIEASIIDVPGHERFVKNMVAGAATVDLVLFVVAANEGIMPQTREHLQIITLLGITSGITVLTKTDLVEPDILAVVKDEIADMVGSTFLSGAPVIETSAATGAGIDALKREILKLSASVKSKDSSGIFRLPIDRVFTMTGFGTVVTGTTIAGTVTTGDMVDILPDRVKTRVRGLEVHNRPRDTSSAGERTAVNLADVETAGLARGDILTVPDLLAPTVLVTAELTLLPDAKTLKQRSRLRFHCLTRETLCRLRLFDRSGLAPGQSANVQFILEEPVGLLRGDRFIIRSYSPSHTIGGGRIVDAFATAIKKGDPEAHSWTRRIASAEGAPLIEEFLLGRTPYFHTTDELARFTGIPPVTINAIIADLARRDRIEPIKKGAVHTTVFDRWRKTVTDGLETFFKNNPHHLDIGKSELKIDAPVPEPALELILAKLESAGVVKIDGEKIRLLTRRVDLPPLARKIEQAFAEGGIQPPDLALVSTRLGLKPDELRRNITTLAELGRLVDAGEGIVFHKEVVDRAIAMLKTTYRGGTPITVSDFRQALATSRKYALPLLNYLDKIGVTRRRGEARVLVTR